jgi:hypothetical protein
MTIDTSRQRLVGLGALAVAAPGEGRHTPRLRGSGSRSSARPRRCKSPKLGLQAIHPSCVGRLIV